MKTITLPKHMVERMLRVTIAFEDLREELEDYLVARQPQLLKKLRAARREHLAGDVHPFVQSR